MIGPRINLEDDLVARAAWSRLVEPGDTSAGGLIAALGAGGALRWVMGTRESPEALAHSVVALEDSVGALTPAARTRLSAAAAR
jgi:DNA processing protein